MGRKGRMEKDQSRKPKKEWSAWTHILLRMLFSGKGSALVHRRKERSKILESSDIEKPL